MSTSSAPRLANTVYIDWLKSRIADKLISNKQNENEDEDDDENEQQRYDKNEEEELKKLELLESLWTHEHSETASIFLLTPSVHCLFVSIDEDGLTSSRTLSVFVRPSQFSHLMKRVLYFVKDGSYEIMDTNLNSVLSGLILDNPLDTLLKILKCKFAPSLLKEKSQWPDSKYIK